MRTHVQDQTHSALAKAQVLEETTEAEEENDCEESRESEAPASLGFDSDSGVAGLMRGWKSMDLPVLKTFSGGEGGPCLVGVPGRRF